jgi:hypothetical protein
MVRDSVEFLRGAGLDVLFDAEHFFDGYRRNPEFSLRVLEGDLSMKASALVATLVVAGVTFVGTWLVVRGARRGAAVTVFFATWAVTILATALGAYAGFVIRSHDRIFDAGIASQHGLVADFGALYGFSWGWVAALLASLAWLLFSRSEPRPLAPGSPGPG